MTETHHTDWGWWATIYGLLAVAVLALVMLGWNATHGPPLRQGGDGGTVTVPTVAPAVEYQAEPAP